MGRANTRTAAGRRRARDVGLVAAAVAVGAAVGAVVMAGPVAWSTLRWAEQHTAHGRLLPNTVVAGVDVGGSHPESARAAVADAVESGLAETVALTHGDERWTTTGAALTAGVDADAAVEQARADAETASLLRLARARWGGDAGAIAVDAPVRVDADEVAAFVDRAADDTDRDPRDATVAWEGGGAELVEHRIGRRADRDAAVRAVTAAVVAAQPGEHELAVASEPVAVTTADVAPLVDTVAATAERTLRRPVTLRTAGREWQVTPGDLGAMPDTAAVLARLRDRDGDDAAPTAPSHGATVRRAGAETVADQAVAADGLTIYEGVSVPAATGSATAAAGEARVVEPAPLAVTDDAIADAVADLAADIDRDVRDAHLDYAGGWVDVVEARPGRELDRDAAAEELRDALRGHADAVELPVETTEPTHTADAYHDVLLVRRGDRRVYHYVDGDIARSWPVAVGGGGSPTPTGQFTVGAKRHSPTWYNPDPDGWGEDMDEVIGPGPDNPLGLRALNWNRGGADTLIRFHGTANVHSIGQAASRGCVRLTNADVVELYNRIPSGTPIVSV